MPSLQNPAAAAVTLVILVFTSLVIFAPKMRLGGTAIVLYKRTVQADPALESELAALKAENARLQEALSAALMTAVRNEKAAVRSRMNSAAVNISADDPTLVKIDLVRFLGLHSYIHGISYDPFVCFPPLSEVFPNASEHVKKATERCMQDLVEELAKVHGVDPKQVDPNRMYHLQDFTKNQFPERMDDAIRPLSADPKYQEWRTSISRVMGRYLCDANGHLHVNCAGGAAKEDISQLGDHCRSITSEEALQALGYYLVPFDTPRQMAIVMSSGSCFTHVRNNRASFAHWITQERMTDEWQTFNVEDREQDKVLLLFDMLYEKQLVFTKQYWMGVVTMQNPFDMYSIQDIMYNTRPDLLIETGTANGGSALLWAGIMELIGLEASRILTVDVESPVWTEGRGFGGSTAPRADPTKDKLWLKRVTFVKGMTNDPKVLAQVQAAAEGKKAVMVLLDSGHDKENVAAELKAYCKYVTIGAYCIVEDTKMSRWHSTGPLAAVREYLRKHPEFEMDRTRELLYTHHAMGYLKRIR